MPTSPSETPFQGWPYRHPSNTAGPQVPGRWRKMADGGHRRHSMGLNVEPRPLEALQPCTRPVGSYRCRTPAQPSSVPGTHPTYCPPSVKYSPPPVTSESLSATCWSMSTALCCAGGARPSPFGTSSRRPLHPLLNIGHVLNSVRLEAAQMPRRRCRACLEATGGRVRWSR